MKTNLKLAAVFLFAIAVFSACTPAKQLYSDGDTKLAEKVVEQFHKLYNEQNYEEIFNTAHEEAKRTKSKELLGLKLAESFEKYGKYQSSELVYTKVTPIGDKGKQVEFAYKSKFEKGVRNETFLIVTKDQNAALNSIGELTDEDLEKLKTNEASEKPKADEKPEKLKSN